MDLQQWVYLICLVFVCAASALVFSESVSSLQPSCIPHERLVLLQFKTNFHIDCSVSFVLLSFEGMASAPHPKLDSWIDGVNENCCSWDGVECDNKTDHITGLDLESSCLYGTFPRNSTLFSLTHLITLNLSYNHFNYSQIPSEIGGLAKLQYLHLFGSSFSGSVPVEISNIQGLKALDIGDDFKGSLPNLKLSNAVLQKFVQNLTQLQHLTIASVDISSIVPIVLTNLTYLQSLHIDYSYLYGELPSDFFNMPHLETLSLDGNNDLAGSLPEFQWHSPLKYISLFGTSMSGEVPPSIGRLARLEFLNLWWGQFAGAIPSSLGNLTKLSYLNLIGNDFTGMLPPSMSNLTGLQELYLSHLSVSPGHLISYLHKLHKLTDLGLGGMNLNTKIPSFLANLTEISRLNLSKTKLFGTIPQWFSNFTKLEILCLDKNQLEGPIPQGFSKLTNLQRLDISYNNLFGNFEIFSNLTNLHSLVISDVNLHLPHHNSITNTNTSLCNLRFLELPLCNLTEFPPFLQHYTKLQHLALDHNRITGKIPQWFINATKESLVYLDLSNNYLTGFEQPVEVLPWPHLEVFEITGNNFQGFFPVPPASMHVYSVADNNLPGVIPHQICTARFLSVLDLSNNSMGGRIPHCISDRLGESLQVLNLRGNNFNGTIPAAFTTGCKLKMINLSENNLEGQLPRSLINCTMLVLLDVGKNHVHDTFPTWLGSLPNLQVLVISHNNLHGSIRDGELVPHFRHLHVIDVSHNTLTGDLPSSYLQNWHGMMLTKEDQFDSSNNRVFFIFTSEASYFYYLDFEYSMTITNKGSEQLYPKILSVFRVIDFSSNKFTGQIPDAIGDLNGLQALNLSNNNLHGRIPSSLANMTDLEALDLSHNKLSGKISTELSQLTSLAVFDVSYNHLMGPIPQGSQFNSFDDSSYEGNPGLCGTPLSNKCGDEDTPVLRPPVTTDESNEQSSFIDWVVRLSGCLSGFIIGYVIGKFFLTDRFHEWFEEKFQMRSRRKAEKSNRHGL